jgi:hypothetical protein
LIWFDLRTGIRPAFKSAVMIIRSVLPAIAGQRKARERTKRVGPVLGIHPANV